MLNDFKLKLFSSRHTKCPWIEYSSIHTNEMDQIIPIINVMRGGFDTLWNVINVHPFDGFSVGTAENILTLWHEKSPEMWFLPPFKHRNGIDELRIRHNWTGPDDTKPRFQVGNVPFGPCTFQQAGRTYPFGDAELNIWQEFNCVQTISHIATRFCQHPNSLYTSSRVDFERIRRDANQHLLELELDLRSSINNRIDEFNHRTLTKTLNKETK